MTKNFTVTKAKASNAPLFASLMLHLQHCRDGAVAADRLACSGRISSEAINMDGSWQSFREWCLSELERAQSALDAMEQGKLKMHEQRAGGPMIETTQQQMESCRRTIATSRDMIAKIDADHSG